MVASYQIAELGIHNVKVVGKTPIIMDLTLFVDKDQPELHAIIDKALKSISKTESQDILQGWIRSKDVEKTDYTVVFEIGIGMALLLISALLWNRKLKTEIKHRKRTEQALRQSEERYDLAMQVANDGIWDWRVGQNTVLYDDRYYTMAGYQPGDFPGAP